MFALPIASYAPGPGLTRQYVDMTFVRVRSVASFQLQQYLYMEYICKIQIHVRLRSVFSTQICVLQQIHII